MPLETNRSELLTHLRGAHTIILNLLRSIRMCLRMYVYVYVSMCV
jgi:hypothetical protein